MSRHVTPHITVSTRLVLNQQVGESHLEHKNMFPEIKFAFGRVKFGVLKCLNIWTFYPAVFIH
jgi:hypothetical protein